MKFLTTITIIFYSTILLAQSGKIYPKEKPIPGEINTFIYEPPTNVKLPKVLWAFSISDPQIIINSPLLKKDKHYEFSLKLPESTNYCFVYIENKEQRIYDHNNDLGYDIYLKHPPKENPIRALIDKSDLCWYANMTGFLWDYTKILSDLHQIYIDNPALKNQESYQNYLKFAYSKEYLKRKTEVLENIVNLTKKSNEESLIKLHYWYERLKLKTKKDSLTEQILKKHPKGTIAKRVFIDDYKNKIDKTEKSILTEQSEFISKFKDSSHTFNQYFEKDLINLYLEQQDTSLVYEIENTYDDKWEIAKLYNQVAWKLSGEGLTSDGLNLDFAAQISKKSLKIMKILINNYNYSSPLLWHQNSYNQFADTYALILYKQGEYQKAFDYQHQIALQDALDTGGKERYAVYAEKVKGLEFTKNYIESELKRDVNSKVLVNQLESIYQKLSSKDEAAQSKIKKHNEKLIKINQQEVIDVLGSIEAPDFELENLNGQKAKLSDLRGKLVVLDFWATWCGPCKRSFPHMNELVKKNPEVEFLFIDVWERDEENVVKEKVKKYLADKNYDFNVLFDFSREVPNAYQVRGIPAKFLIDKNGNIVSIIKSNSNLQALIDEYK